MAVEFLTKPGYGYQPGWFIRVFDFEKQAERSFALCNVILDEELREGYAPNFTLFRLSKPEEPTTHE